MQTKFVFICGGVLSGLGKGLVTSSIGLLLKERGFKTTAVKIDPYVNIDAGTMRPAEHGEVFVTDDGGEIDQDLGNYERFLNVSLTKNNNITTGKVFLNVINNERSFKYEGRDVEIFPDVINEVKRMIVEPSKGFDFCLVEIGGTTGDVENLIFLHAARELGREYPSIYIMVTYVPFLRNVGELKTKPTQHAVAKLREVGIFPDIIITRNEIPLDKPRIETISKRCFVSEDCIFDNPDIENIYEIPLILEKNGLVKKILEKFRMKQVEPNLKKWEDFVNGLKYHDKIVKVGIVGKYFIHGSTKHKDVYISVVEALKHASSKNKIGLEIVGIDSSEVEKNGVNMLKGIDGIIVPQGWGSRGTEGKIKAIEFARVNKIPYLGLCFGMQMAVIEFARNVCGLNGANSTEVDPKTPYPVIHIMPDQEEYLKKKQYGGTIRLGSWPCRLNEKSMIYRIYKKHKKIEDGIIFERHRHRYEFNNEFRVLMEKKGLVIGGVSPDGKLVESIELPESVHPFFIGTQFHPEYKSRPLDPHPLFLEFLNSCVKK
ncbi:MAG: CTP synthase [Candidatus Aenigmatarchaeota archaeon]